MENPTKNSSLCPKCGHPNHKSKMHQDICTFYVKKWEAECGCNYPQVAVSSEKMEREIVGYMCSGDWDKISRNLDNTNPKLAISVWIPALFGTTEALYNARHCAGVSCTVKKVVIRVEDPICAT